jgi:hypothetical protein
VDAASLATGGTEWNGAGGLQSSIYQKVGSCQPVTGTLEELLTHVLDFPNESAPLQDWVSVCIRKYTSLIIASPPILLGLFTATVHYGCMGPVLRLP